MKHRDACGSSPPAQLRLRLWPRRLCPPLLTLPYVLCGFALRPPSCASPLSAVRWCMLGKSLLAELRPITVLISDSQSENQEIRVRHRHLRSIREELMSIRERFESFEGLQEVHDEDLMKKRPLD